tara:strand:+ start:2837 stop:3178 length:342 start_codon:yes stop_codon:yes gene_type:complete
MIEITGKEQAEYLLENSAINQELTRFTETFCSLHRYDYDWYKLGDLFEGNAKKLWVACAHAIRNRQWKEEADYKKAYENGEIEMDEFIRLIDDSLYVKDSMIAKTFGKISERE